MPAIDVVSSLASKVVKHMLKLGSNPRYSARHQTGLVAGSQHQVADVLRLSASPPVNLLLPVSHGQGRQVASTLDGYSATHLATANVLQRLLGVDSLAEGRAAAAELPLPLTPSMAECANWDRLLVLDGVSDPGNVGALLRSALGLGWDGVLMTQGCASVANPKVFRSSGGLGAWALPYRGSMPWAGEDGIAAILQKGNFVPLVADASPIPIDAWLAQARSEQRHRALARSVGVFDNQPLGKKVQGPRIALVLGSEGSGVSEDARALHGAEVVGLQLAGNLESLGVAQAGPILLHRLDKCCCEP